MDINKESAKQEVRTSWKQLYRVDKKGKGIICPLCGSGSGKNGTGITANSNHGKPYSLKCWSCGFSGDVIDLIMQETGADFDTALCDATARLGITVDSYKPTGSIKKEFNKSVDKKPEKIADYTEYYKKCKENLNHPEAISYLQGRGISLETAKAYSVGYDDTWISPTVIKNQKEKGSSWIPKSSKRIIVPVKKNHYVSRAIDPEAEFQKMNETGGGTVGIFNENVLYGGCKVVFVTEGVFDALSIKEAGGEAISLNSANNADLLIQLLRNKTTAATLILCLDSDSSGQKAHEPIRKGLSRLKISYAEMNIFGGYKDPNEALMENREEFIAAVKNAQMQTGGMNLSNRTNKFPLISMDEVQEQEMEWLIPQLIPKRSITLIAGDGGSGKTTAWCGTAAAISTGRKAFFDSTPDEFAKCEPKRVLFFSSEDSLEFTLKARLRKAGADLSNIFSISLASEAFSNVKFNSQYLKDLIREIRPALCIFDPIQSFIPPNLNMGQRNAMRDCLNSLVGLGEEFDTTFIIVVHTNKKIGVYGRNRISDSADIWDISRSVLIIGSVPDEKGKRYLSQEKNNYSEEAQTVIFTIEDGVAKFCEHSGKKDIDFVKERDANSYQAPQRKDAERFITEFLKNGKKPTKELDEVASAEGISISTLKRAKAELSKAGVLGTMSEGYAQGKIFYSFLKEQSP